VFQVLDNWRAQVREYIFSILLFRTLIAGTILVRSRIHHVFRRYYKEASDLCWLGRVSRIPIFASVGERYVTSLVICTRNGNHNSLRHHFLNSHDAVQTKRSYSLFGEGQLDIFRNLIVLKESAGKERGVLLIKYTPTFDAVIAFFDLEGIQREYYIVLEPSWAGYCDPSVLLFLSHEHPVFIQCPEPEDYRYIQSLGSNLVPLDFGSADWVDADLFESGRNVDKEFDVVMVANWGRHKRHHELFRALSTIRDRRLRVLLIGFPWGGRTKDTIRAEAGSFSLAHVELVIEENLTAQQVADYLRRSRVFVLLSKKEGPNKAIVEAIFCDIPVIVYDGFVGGAQTKIQPHTGRLSSDRDLGASILYTLDHLEGFSPREWALQHTGSSRTTQRLTESIRSIAETGDVPWTKGIWEKVNNPNLSYRDPGLPVSADFSKSLLGRYMWMSRG